MQSDVIPAGWYEFGDGSVVRWWDGERWTADVRSRPATQVEPMGSRPVAPGLGAAGRRQLLVDGGAEPSSPAPVAQHPAVAINLGYDQRRTSGARVDVKPFFFDGGAATYVGTGILALVVTLCTFGIAFPFALVLRERWKAKHTYVEGRRLMFTGTGMGLFGNWIIWLALSVVTLGVYLFWVTPRVTKWKVEHLAFDPRG